jgi:hypothetical protein
MNNKVEAAGQNQRMLEQILPPGWKVEKGDNKLLVPIQSNGGRFCVDGRKVLGLQENDPLLYGAKVQGGTEGDALLIAKNQGRQFVDEEVFRLACELNVAKGLLPVVHDMVHGLHCGHCKLLREGKFGNGWPQLKLEPSRMAEIVAEYGGRHIELEGEHVEKSVRVVFHRDMTLRPSWDAFNLNAHEHWLMDYSQADLLFNAVATVQGLTETVRTIQVFE